jgi:glycosyltransferase involved in cell wall biosynthesis
MPPKISIVTPSFNQAQFLESTIQSILSQNYPNLEYVIIDGGSSDGSQAIIERYSEYLHFWCSEPDGGQYDAINKGFQHTTGEIMAWLNSDDMLCPWALRTVASVMESLPQVRWLTSLNLTYWDYCSFCSGISNLPGYSLEAFLDGCYLPPLGGIGFIQQESTFWRRDLWNDAGGYLNQDIQLAADFELWCRFFGHASLYGVDSPLGGFRRQQAQKSAQLDSYVDEAIPLLMDLRRSLNWQPNQLRNAFLKLRLNRLPKISKYVTQRTGYVAEKVIREKASTPDGYWAILKYKFLQ